MLFNINATKQLVFTVCIALTLCMTGCRSGRLGSTGLFGFNSQPSAEALAGNGPTTTYPAPPSESATPEAIASLAGGTVAPSTFGQNSIATNSVAPNTQPYRGSAAFAGLDIDAGKVEPVTATAPNMSASQANGFYGNTKSAGFSVPEMKTPQVQMPKMSAPSGYQFGGSPFASTSTTNNTASTAPEYAMPNAIQSPSKTSEPQTNAFVVPDMPAVKTRLTDNPGMSLPGSLAEKATEAVSAAQTVFTPKVNALQGAIADVSLPNMQASEVQMPSVQIGGNLGTPQVSLPDASVATGTNMPQGYSTGGGYSPGSTSEASGYPSGGYATPSSSGSFYR